MGHKEILCAHLTPLIPKIGSSCILQSYYLVAFILTICVDRSCSLQDANTPESNISSLFWPLPCYASVSTRLLELHKTQAIYHFIE